MEQIEEKFYYQPYFVHPNEILNYSGSTETMIEFYSTILKQENEVSVQALSDLLCIKNMRVILDVAIFVHEKNLTEITQTLKIYQQSCLLIQRAHLEIQNEFEMIF